MSFSNTGREGNEGRYGFKYDIIDDFVKKEKNKSKWDNGVDWKHPSSSAGDWVRVYPFRPAIQEPRKTKSCPSYVNVKEPGWKGGNKEIRDIVAQVAKYYKTARDSFVRNKHSDDSAKDGHLISTAKVCDEVWHPLL